MTVTMFWGSEPDWGAINDDNNLGQWVRYYTTAVTNGTFVTRDGYWNLANVSPECPYCGRADTYQTVKGNRECGGCGAPR